MTCRICRTTRRKRKVRIRNISSRSKSEGADPKQLRGRLARLATSVLKRLEKQPNPGSIIGEFSKTYLAVTQKHEALPLEELSRRFPYPLGYTLKSFLDDQKLFESGENVPQFPYDCCTVMGLLVRISATIGIQGYVNILGGKDAGLNQEIVETLRAPADELTPW